MFGAILPLQTGSSTWFVDKRMSYRDPLINTGEGGDFQSYLEDTDVETGNSIVHLDSFLSRVS